MQRKYDAHPQDQEMLMRIRRYLIGYRITNGWTQFELSKKINGTSHAAYNLERGDFDWTLRRLQRWPEPFDLQLKATPSFTGRPLASSEMWCEVIETDPSLKWLSELMQTTTGSQRHNWQRQYLVTYLRVARETQGISLPELGSRFGVRGDSLRSWEATSDNVRLLRLLNHARALGGTIVLGIEDARREYSQADSGVAGEATSS